MCLYIYDKTLYSLYLTLWLNTNPIKSTQEKSKLKEIEELLDIAKFRFSILKFYIQNVLFISTLHYSYNYVWK